MTCKAVDIVRFFFFHSIPKNLSFTHTHIYKYNTHIHTHAHTFSTPKAKKVIYRTDEQISSDLSPDIRSDSGVF